MLNVLDSILFGPLVQEPDTHDKVLDMLHVCAGFIFGSSRVSIPLIPM